MQILWIALAILGIGLALLIVNHDGGRVFGLQNDIFASLLYLSLWVSVLIVGLAGHYYRRGNMLRDLAFWALLILILSVLYAYRLDLAAWVGL
ncbi:hypothetical protein [Nitratireductor thuwali]|uniref:Uncharacterized protein n=1 Tax=Nitratireductor thuwali TaxID=2267699 RepID=A0ABY5MFV6_9HYPH|nr:hypothetical protein NTH_00051 [Nitratireductor thuwali]